MKLQEINKYLTDIAEHEFLERNHDLISSITLLKGEMNARGILISSITLKKLAEFLLKEFGVRADFVKNLIISYGTNIDFNSGDDPITETKIIFQRISLAEKKYIENTYSNTANPITSGLQSNIPNEILDHLIEGMNRQLHKNNLYVELTYKIYQENKALGKNIIELSPKFYGIGIDLKALWKRYFS